MFTQIINKNKTLFSVLFLAVIFYFIFFHNIGSYPLMDIDETRYVLMSKDMLKSHDFMTLYLNGEYFFEKPPLYFWIECIFFKLFGFVNEFSARFPAALSGMLLCYAVYFAGKKFISNFYGVVSSLVLATCLEFTILSKYAILDIYLCLFCALSVFSYFGTHVAKEKNKKYFWWLFYLFCALAVMAKGIPGLVIPAGTVFLSSLYTKTFKEIFKPLYIIPGIVLFLAITLPWHIIMIKTHPADPSFFHEYVIKHHLQRFVNSKELGRKQPWFYFLVTLCWGLVPWVASLIAVFVAKIKNFSIKTWVCDYQNKPKLFFVLNVNSLLYDKDGKYNNGYLQLILKSFDKDFLNEVEEDFRLQIETVLSKTPVDHIDSHVHVHAIPNIFKIVCKLAREYGIKHIRTQFEYPYFVPDVKKYLTVKYPVNWIKLLLLNSFTIINKKYLETIEGVTTNKNFVGVNYTGYMDKNTLLCALPFVSEKTEAVLHPSINPVQPFHYKEYQSLIEREVIEKLQKSEIDLINFSGEIKF